MNDLQSIITDEDVEIDKALSEIDEGLSGGSGAQAAHGFRRLGCCNRPHRELLASMFEGGEELPRLYPWRFQQTRRCKFHNASADLRTALQIGDTAAVVAKLRADCEVPSDDFLALLAFLEEPDNSKGTWPYKFVRRRGRPCDVLWREAETTRIRWSFEREWEKEKQRQRQSLQRRVLAKVVIGNLEKQEGLSRSTIYAAIKKGNSQREFAGRLSA
jgi:hypothetical protein